MNRDQRSSSFPAVPGPGWRADRAQETLRAVLDAARLPDAGALRAGPAG